MYFQDRSDKVSGKETAFDSLARKQEIFLDILSSNCSQNGHTKFLFNDRYEDALTEGEKELKNCIRELDRSLKRYNLKRILCKVKTINIFLCRLSDESKQTSAYINFMKSLENFGL